MYIQRWGWSILLLILLHGVFWYFANIRDGYSNSIVHAIDGSTEMGLFSANSAQSIVFWIASIAIWLLGSLAIFKPQVRKPVFFIMAALSVFSMGFIEASRILSLIHIFCATSPEEGTILLRQSPCGAFTDAMPLHFSIGHPAHGQQTLHYVSVMHPCINNGYSVKLSLMLDAKAPLYVEQAVMDVVEL